MKYIISYNKPNNHYIDIEFVVDNVKEDELLLQLPAWRPGRYELGNFAKNVQKWNAFDEKGNLLKAEKVTKDCWVIQTKGVTEVRVKYNYFAAELNAGSTYLDDEQLYMNPVNCCLYVPERMDEKCELTLILPDDYKVAIGLTSSKRSTIKEEHTFLFDDFHELADSPFIASNSLQSQQFDCEGVEFYIWFQGECKPNWAKVIHDFQKFIKEQMQMMKSFPANTYHFLFQILSKRRYHGVEHLSSTVIALGPGYNLMKGSVYEDLLGVSSHELFHAWNIKSIRPVEMFPYDYSKENYSKLGYVSEGVTTYYGDLFLRRSGVFTQEQYFKTFNERLQKHFDNFGRFNLSVSESSFDSWLDGYAKGADNRKTSIYDEGCLLAFITDMFVRKYSSNKYSLDDVMVYLFDEFALKGKGYSEYDYKGVVEHFANNSFDEIFDDYINKATDLKLVLLDSMDYVGCELDLSPASQNYEHSMGIKTSELNGVCKIISVYPNSVADNAGLVLGDIIISVNKMQIVQEGLSTNFSDWYNYFYDNILSADEISLSFNIVSDNKLREVSIAPKKNAYYTTASIQKQQNPSVVQKRNFELWTKNKF